ncbi:Serine-threonine kinase receptor-associated protein [Mycena kentingensis (nom. inval.)]|nr:Serine-threonine kinase receptor-associated protein [Mycena kentingensis (nom. inval.)]
MVTCYITCTMPSSSPHRRSSASHHRSPSDASNHGDLPTQTRHSSLLPAAVPTTALVESVAGAAHYSGSSVEPLKHRHSSHEPQEDHSVLKDGHQQVLNDLRELYECRPTPVIFARSWHKDAVFEDPLVHAQGFREYAAQWYAMPKLFRSDTVSTRVMSSTTVPNRIVFAQTQRYKNRLMDKTISSIITVDLDGEGKIIRMVELWDGQPLPSWMGSGALRRLSAKLGKYLVNTPK